MTKTPSRNTRIKRLMRNIPAERKDEATRLAEDILFMQDELEAFRAEHAGEGATITYDNGGGQFGERENPALSMYHKMLRAYLGALDRIDAMREPEEPDSLLSILD